MAALSSFIVTRNDRYAHDCRDRAAVTRWRRPGIQNVLSSVSYFFEYLRSEIGYRCDD